MKRTRTVKKTIHHNQAHDGFCYGCSEKHLQIYELETYANGDWWDRCWCSGCGNESYSVTRETQKVALASLGHAVDHNIVKETEVNPYA